jgi:RNA polymerase sigma-70 factor, ECF subfamily
MAAVNTVSQIEPGDHCTATATLGDVLYAKRPNALESEALWVQLVRAIAAGNQSALHALYERAHRPVFTVIVRITANRENAEELTLDVFHDVWRRASRYDPADGTVLGWIMNQARSRAIDRIRFDRRLKRVDVDDRLTPSQTVADPQDVAAFRQQGRALRESLGTLTPEERQTMEAAFFGELTYAEVAARLQQPLGTVKTRIRTALHKLRQACDAQRGKA